MESIPVMKGRRSLPTGEACNDAQNLIVIEGLPRIVCHLYRQPLLFDAKYPYDKQKQPPILPPIESNDSTKRLCLIDGRYNNEEEAMIGKIIKKALELYKPRLSSPVE